MTDLRTAAQQALEALEAGPDVDPIFAGETEDALRAALAEPVQEPVGVVTSMVKGGVTWHRWPSDMPDGTTFYTAPPQRKPLTEEEIIDLWAGVSDPESPDISMIDFARAIERAHGIT